MSKSILKNIILVFFVFGNLFILNKSMPTLILLKTYVAISVAPFIFIFFIKRDLLNMLLLWFVLVLFKDMGRLPIPMLPDIFPFRLVWIMMVSFFVFELMSKKREKILPISGIEISMIMFSILSIFSMIKSGTFYSSEKGLTLNMFLNGYGIPFTIFFLAKNIVQDHHQARKVFVFFAIVGVYLGLTGIFEHYGVRELVFPKFIMSRWEGGQWGRARGPFMNSSVNGTAMGVIIIMMIYLLISEKQVWKKYYFSAVLAALFAGLLFTMTRGSWLAVIIACFAAAIYIPQVRKVLIPAVLILTIYVSFIIFTGNIVQKDFKSEIDSDLLKASLIERLIYRTSNVKTITGRVDLLKLSFGMFLKRPLLGYGYGTFNEAKKEYVAEAKGIISQDAFITEKATSHATLVTILLDLGLVGFGFLAFIILAIARACKQYYDRVGEDVPYGRELAVTCFCMLIVFFINIQTIEMRFFMFPNSLFFFVSGIIVALNQRLSIQGSGGFKTPVITLEK